MQFDDDVSPAKSKSIKYDFTNAADGRSLWLATNNERIAALKAFARWRETSGSKLAVTSSAVGPDDRRGAGYRVFFHAERETMKPAVRAAMPLYSAFDVTQIVQMNHTCIYSQDDVNAAIFSVFGRVPTTIAEAKAARRLMWTWKTPWQIERMREAGRETREELDRKYVADQAAARAKLGYRELSPEEVERLDAEDDERAARDWGMAEK